MLVMATLAVMKNATADPKSTITAQFNPQTLTVAYSNRGPLAATTMTADGKEANTSNSQSTGYSSTLSVELLFDTSESGQDVRSQTLGIVRMMLAAGNTSPRVRFLWGNFLYYGRIESVNETLDYWSELGIPLRATVSLSMSSDKLDTVDTGAGFGMGVSASVGASAGAAAGISASAGLSASANISVNAGVGTQALTFAQSGESLQTLSARAGVDWKVAAAANGIDNPRMMRAGTVLNLNIGNRKG